LFFPLYGTYVHVLFLTAFCKRLKHCMKKIFYFRPLLAVCCFLWLLLLPAILGAQTGEYKVWVKTNPCSGRYDWISVGKENPGGGGLNYYSLANTIFPGAGCTTYGCTFTEATAVANSLRPSPEFLKYCCRDYSVWENPATKERTVVLGKFGTAPGWLFVRGELCCEEAEALAGKPGVCSGDPNIQQLVKNTKCWPGSYAAWNAQAQRVECYCLPGKVWNSTRTACVDDVTQIKCWPGSYAAVNPQTGKTECYCNPGLVWNSTKTACIQPATQVNCWPGSYAAVNPQTGQTECYCNPGLVWNSTKTACIQPTTQVNCWPGSYAAVNPQTGKTECYCNPGLVWNSTKTACIQPTTQVTCWPGSYAAVNPQTGKTECYCNPGLVWNSTKTACIQPTAQVNCWPGSYAAVNPQTGQTECYCNPGLVWNSTRTACITPGPGGAGTWRLVSATVTPQTPAQGWSFSGAGAGSAHFDVYNGDKIDYQWTPPPQQFGSGGFTMSLNVQGKPIGQGRMACLISSTGYGLEPSIPEKETSAYGTSENGNTASASKSWTYTPSTTASEIEVLISLNWGSVKFSYKYQKM
jgi:hypothetical protein